MRTIRSLYTSKEFDKDNPPDTSYIYTCPEIQSQGMLLIGELDLEKMRDKDEWGDANKDAEGNLMPCIKRWHRGYWMIDINYEQGEVKFKNCLITWNQEVLKAMKLEFESIKKRSKEHVLSSHMTSEMRKKVMDKIAIELGIKPHSTPKKRRKVGRP